MKHILCIILFYSAAFASHAQDYLTRNGNVSFFSHTSLEDIKASNNEVVSLLSSAGNIDFKIAVKSFHFSKQAMEDHFNGADYMDSEKFPKASFGGKIVNISEVNFSKDGTYNVTVQGSITIKDITKPVTAKGTITISGGKATATATFSIKRKDFNVIGESFVQKKIAEDIQVTVNCAYEKR
mgnify:CR=1 FL=1